MKKIISLFLINLLICFSAFSFGYPHKLYPTKGLKKSTFKFTYMKFRFLFFIPLLFLTINLFGIQNPTSKNFRVNAFHSLEIGNAFEIHIKKGNVFSISALGRAEDLQEIELKQNGNNLHVYRDTNTNLRILKAKKIKFRKFPTGFRTSYSIVGHQLLNHIVQFPLTNKMRYFLGLPFYYE